LTHTFQDAYNQHFKGAERLLIQDGILSHFWRSTTAAVVSSSINPMRTTDISLFNSIPQIGDSLLT